MDNSKKRKTENGKKKMKLKAEHKNILMVVGGIVSLGILVALATALARKPAVHAPTVVPTQPPMQCPAPPQCPAPMQCPACPREPPQREAQPPQREAEPLEQTFADVASTVMSRAGVDDRINPAISTKNGGMLPILDVRGDYDPLMPYEDARCDENGRWNQSSRQQGIRLGLIRDQMKRRVVVQ
jgi:hypothetical protein